MRRKLTGAAVVMAVGAAYLTACGDAVIEAVDSTESPIVECDEESDDEVADLAPATSTLSPAAAKDAGAKPKVCKDAGKDAGKADASKDAGKKACDPADLAPGCSCEKLEELYGLQKEICSQVRACKEGEFCANLDDKMSKRRNCINLRREVQLCYKKPDFGGHQEQIDSQCRGLQDCADFWRKKSCGDDLPIVVPPACPTVK